MDELKRISDVDLMEAFDTVEDFQHQLRNLAGAQMKADLIPFNKLKAEIAQLKADKKGMIDEIQIKIEPHYKNFVLINIIPEDWWQAFTARYEE